MYKVSIVIPTMNRMEFLESSIASAYQQTFNKKEVIVSNNNSSDSTEKELKRLQEKYHDLIVVNHKETLPLSRHWDTILKKYVSGDLVLLIPDDDIITDCEYLNKVVNLYEKYPNLGLVFANYSIVDENGGLVKKVNAEFDELINNEFLFSNYNKELFGIKGIGVSHLTTVFSKDIYKKVGGFDLECMSPDTYLWLKILLNYDAGFIKDNVAHYLVHSNNLSKSVNLDFLLSDTKIPQEIKKYASSSNLNANTIDDTLLRMKRIFHNRYNRVVLKRIRKFKYTELRYIHKIGWKYVFIWYLNKVNKIFGINNDT